MINVQEEQVIPLAAYAREVPNREAGLGVNLSTVFRWSLKGLRGIKLETIVVGGIRMTSREAGQRFFERITAVANGEAAPAVPSKKRESRMKAAERELAEAGA